jgi:DNA polymerase III gamma/tau subunit
LEQLLESEHHLRLSLAREVALEILILRLCEMRERVSLETILKKLAVPGSETRAEAAASHPPAKPSPASPPPAPTPSKATSSKATPPPTSTSSAKETFLNDPGIKNALKGFDVRIIDR